MRSKALLVLIIGAIVVVAGIWGIYRSPVFIAINYSTSLTERLFVWHKAVPAVLARDNFVFFTYQTFPGSLYFNTGERLIKKIAGLPGDTVEFSTELHKVCSPLTRGAAPQCQEFPRESIDRKNKILPIPFQAQGQFKGTFVIPEGQFYVYGTNPQSYDSRYFGLISRDQLIGKLDPIF